MDSTDPTTGSTPNPDEPAVPPTTAADAAEGGETTQPVKKVPPWVRKNFPPPPPLADGIFTKKPWVGFLLPFIVYMVAGMFEPTPPKVEAEKPEATNVVYFAEAKPADDDPTLDPVGKNADGDLPDLFGDSKSDSDAKTDRDAGDAADPAMTDPFADPVPEDDTDAEPKKPAEPAAEHKEEEKGFFDGWFEGWFDWMDVTKTLGITYDYYPLIYTIKIALTLAAMAFVMPVYRTFYPVRVGGLAVFVGVIGIFFWIGLWKFQGQADMLKGLGLGDMGARSAFNPWEQIANPLWRYGFLFVRFLGLVAIVPIIEEFFLRGFLVRYLMRDNFWEVPFGYADDFTFGMATVVPMLMHPGELLPAAVWFTLVSWLMVRTRNIWDCIAAHAITNLLLGLYVVFSGDWALM